MRRPDHAATRVLVHEVAALARPFARAAGALAALVACRLEGAAWVPREEGAVAFVLDGGGDKVCQCRFVRCLSVVLGDTHSANFICDRLEDVEKLVAFVEDARGWLT